MMVKRSRDARPANEERPVLAKGARSTGTPISCCARGRRTKAQTENK